MAALKIGRPDSPAALPEWCRRLMPGKWTALSTVWVGEVMVSPAAAAELLEGHNGSNRPLSPTRAGVIAGRLLRGEWMLTGETLIFDADGQAQSAQHRLRACADSGVPLRSLAVWGVSPDVFAAVDDGAKKTTGDRLAVAGAVNSRCLAAAVGVINVWIATGRPGKPCGNMAACGDYPAVSAFVAARPEIAESVTFAESIRQARKMPHPFGGAAPAAALHWICSRPSAAGRRVFEMMARSVGDSVTPPEWPTVNVLTRRLKDSREPITPGQRMECAVRFFNGYMAGKPLNAVGWRDGEFPRVHGWDYDDQGKPIIA